MIGPNGSKGTHGHAVFMPMHYEGVLKERLQCYRQLRHFHISLYKSGFKGLFAIMPLSKMKLRQFKKNTFDKTSFIKRRVVVTAFVLVAGP